MGNATSVGKCIKSIIVCYPMEDNAQVPEMEEKPIEDQIMNIDLNTATQENRNQFAQYFKEKKIPQEILEVLNRQWEESKELKEIGEFVYNSPLKTKQVRVDSFLTIEKDNTVYNGQVKDGKKHANGQGRLTYATGEYYEGEWKDQKAHGLGKYKDYKGGSYVGYWTLDVQNGYGVEIYKDQSLYRGQFKEGMKHGQGLLLFPNNSLY